MMQPIDMLEQLKVVDPIFFNIATEMQSIEDAFQRGDLSAEERDYLITEVRDVRAAQVCAGNEIAFRHLVQVCNVLLKLI
jgi:hypothetical protein